MKNMKRKMKRITGLVLASMMLVTTCFYDMGVKTDAAVSVEDGYKLDFTPQNMTDTLAAPAYPFVYSAYNCMSQYGNYVVSAGYTNIISYCAPSDGWIRFQWGSVVLSSASEGGKAIEFSITDNDGNILSNDGKVYELNQTTGSVNSISIAAIPIKQGEFLNLVIHGKEGYCNSVQCTGAVEFSTDGTTYTKVSHQSGQVWASDSSNTTQGADNFYYRYATDYRKVPTGGVNMGATMEKKLSFTKQAMTYESESESHVARFVGNNYLSRSEYGQFVGSPSTANIFTVVMPEDGTFRVSSMSLSLHSYEKRSMDFCITDGDGNILYPTDGSVLTLDKNRGSQASIAVTKSGLKQGDEINFVFFNMVYDTANPTQDAAMSWNVMGNIYCNETRMTAAASNHYWPVASTDSASITGNGYNNFWYYYSTDVQVVDKHMDAWENFADLGSFEEVPSTMELMVKIPTTIENDKRGIMLSNSDGTKNGLTVEMFYNGRPRLYTSNQAIDFVVDADIRTGEWTHIAFVNDETANQIACYVNGELKGTYAGCYIADDVGISRNYILGNDHVLDRSLAFQGDMMKVRLWSTAKDASYLGTATSTVIKGTEDGLLAAWDLGNYDSRTNQFPDVSGAHSATVLSPYEKWVEADVPADYDYTMAVIGDTQYYTESESNIANFNNITRYLQDNVSDLKLKFVTQVGDLSVNNEADDYILATGALAKLTSVPYAVVLGNHDYPTYGQALRDSTNFNKYFSEDTYKNMNTLAKSYSVGFYGEYYETETTSGLTTYTVVADDTTEFDSATQVKISDVVTRVCEGQEIAVGDTVALKADNYYQIFEVGSVRYMILNLEFRPRDAVLQWADRVASSNSDCRIIVNTHELTATSNLTTTTGTYFQTSVGETEGFNNGQQIWDEFAKKHENIVMMFCGHEHGDFATGRVMVGDNGNTVYQYMIAPTMGNGGDGVFLLMYFNEENQTVDFRYYSPTTGKYWCKENQFQIPLDNDANVIAHGASNIASQATTFYSQYENGNFYTGDLYNSDSEKYGVLINKQGSFGNCYYSAIRQYQATNAGTANILIKLPSMTNTFGTITDEHYVNFKIYDNRGVNITSQFASGDDVTTAASGNGSATNLQLYPNKGDSYYRLYKGKNGGWLYANVDNITAGDNFYFVTQTDCNTGGSVSLQEKIYISGDIIDTSKTTVTVEGIDGSWASSYDDCPAGENVNTSYGTQGYAGWYYKLAKTADLVYGSEYTATTANIDISIQGSGTIATIQNNVSYANGVITLPHHNSLFIDVTPDEGYVLSAIFYDGQYLTGDLSDTRYCIPCVENGGELQIVFRPATVEVAERVDASYDFDRYMTPYWEGTTVYNESVWVVANEDGTIDDIPLLYSIDSIKAVYSADLRIQYRNGIDYTVSDGKLHIPKNSAIPITSWEEYYPTEEGDNSFANYGNTGYIYYNEGAVIHMKQIAVTYTHSDTWDGYVPVSVLDKLPTTRSKLANKEALSIGFYGDSITTGVNASGVVGAEPNMPSWMDLLVQGLKKQYAYDDITSANYAEGGKKVEWGAKQVATKFSGTNHDLVIVAFGMNNWEEPSYIKEQTKLIIDELRKISPDVEVLLISTTIPNPESCAYNDYRLQYEKALLELAGEGVAVSRMTSVHSYLLQCKRFKDMTANNVNHPNDFLARTYAQTVLASLSTENSTTAPIIGDATGDGKADAVDIVRLKKYLSDSTVTVNRMQAIDVKEDTVIDQEDVKALRKLIVQ